MSWYADAIAYWWTVDNCIRDREYRLHPLCICESGFCIGNRNYNNWFNLIECGDLCSNANCTNRTSEYWSTSNIYNSLRVYDVGSRGSGLFLTQSCPANFIILEYTGEVLDYPEYQHRKDSGRNMDYVMELGDLAFIDASNWWSSARFINHSHDPNVTYDEWHCSGKKKCLISSCRDIYATPEHPAKILADYGWILDPKDDRTLINKNPGYCGAASCTSSLYL